MLGAKLHSRLAPHDLDCCSQRLRRTLKSSIDYEGRSRAACAPPDFHYQLVRDPALWFDAVSLALLGKLRQRLRACKP